MNNLQKIYKFEEHNKDERGIQYFFVSQGQNDILKSVEYTYLSEIDNCRVYNLGFGTYDFEKDTICDDEITGNGDHYRAFNTVLSTVPKFFESHEGSMIMVEGSDSKLSYIDQCRCTCKRRCNPPECKKSNRRINIYKNYVNKNFELLKQEYQILGARNTLDSKKVVEKYCKGQNYNSIFVLKKIA